MDTAVYQMHHLIDYEIQLKHSPNNGETIATAARTDDTEFCYALTMLKENFD
jgi:hypothetical protein